MVSNRPESSTVVQTVQTVRAGQYRRVPGGGTGDYIVVPYHPGPTAVPSRSRRPTVAKTKKGAKSAAWRERFNLPPLAVLEALSKADGVQAEPIDNSRAGRVARLMQQEGKRVDPVFFCLKGLPKSGQEGPCKGGPPSGPSSDPPLPNGVGCTRPPSFYFFPCENEQTT